MKKKNKLISLALLAGTLMTADAISQTANYIPKWNSGSGYGNTVTPIFEDATNLRIGIGTTTPGYKLDVNGHVNISAASAYKIGGNNILWNNNNTADIFVGYNAGNSTMLGHSNTLVGYNAGTSITKAGRGTFIGYQAGYNITTGDSNVAVGYQAMYSNAILNYNTAVGYQALYSSNSITCPDCETNASTNSAFGYKSLYNTQAYGGCAFGFQALTSNTIGCSNVAMGEQVMKSNTEGNDNEAFGESALVFNTTASDNVALGNEALQTQSYNPGAGIVWSSYNVAVGNHALWTNNPTSTSNGIQNTAVGDHSLYSNTTGYINVALGYQSAYSNSTGAGITALGYQAAYNNTTAVQNVALGYQAGYYNQTGTGNTVLGYQAGYGNGSVNSNSTNSFMGYQAGYGITTGSDNVLMGTQSGTNITSGIDNTAIGSQSQRYLTTGTYNSSLGEWALKLVGTGSYNSSVGYLSLLNTTASNNTGIGYNAGQTNTTGTNNTYLGSGADANANNLTNSSAIGNGAIVNASNKIRFGNTAVTVIEGQVAYTTSDGRFKFNIKEEVKGLEFINKLRAVNYQFDTKSFDQFLMKNIPDSVKNKRINAVDYTASTKIIRSGLIAQEVEKAAKDCGFTTDIVHAPTDVNDNYSISYGSMVVPLIKAVQELSKKSDSQDSTIKAQNSRINDLQAQITNCCNNPLGASGSINNTNPNGVSGNSTGTNNGATLFQNIPNPFNQQTSIQYIIPANSQNASIMIFDLQGTLLKTVPITNSGTGSIIINGNEMKPGMFVYSLIVNGSIVDTKRMILTQ